MSIQSILALTLVAFIWGTNFVAMRWALDEFPPFLLGVLRYAFVLIPMAFFVKPPQFVAKKYLIGGGIFAAGQFAFLYHAFEVGMTPGLASLIIQFQVFFTIGLSYLILNEKISLSSGIGIGIAFCGIAIIINYLEAKITLLGLILNLFGALSWSISNIMTKLAKLKPEESMGFTIWSCLYALFFMVVFTLVFEGGERILYALTFASLKGWLSALWQGPANVVVGFVIWNALLSRYPASLVTPFALLVPIFGMLSSVYILNESFPLWKLAACFCVLLGLAINTINSNKIRV